MPQKSKLFGCYDDLKCSRKVSPNHFEIGPPRCGIARALQVYMLRTSFEPCHCQFHANNGDSWRIKPNIETYPLLLLSPSFLPIFSSLSSHSRGLDITKILEARRTKMHLPQYCRDKQSRAMGKLLRDSYWGWTRVCEIGFTWSDPP